MDCPSPCTHTLTGFACAHTEIETEGDRHHTHIQTHTRETDADTDRDKHIAGNRKRETKTDRQRHTPHSPTRVAEDAEKDFQQGIKLGRDGRQSGDQVREYT